MRAAFVQLAELLGPPRPGVVPTPWDSAPAEIGFQFPADYRKLIDTYGLISICGELHVHGPMAKLWFPANSSSGGFTGFVEATTNPYGVPQSFGIAHTEGNLAEAPYPVYPTSGGLFHWGNTYNEHHCWWLMEGADPDAWPVIVAMAGGVDFEWSRFDGGVAEFLVAVCSGQYVHSRELLLDDFFQTDGPGWTFCGDWNGPAGHGS